MTPERACCQPAVLTLAEKRHAIEAEAGTMKVERNFLGSGWTFIEMNDAKAYWVHAELRIWIPSSRNEE